MKQILIALSQLANTLTGGTADESISARAWRTDSVLVPIIDALFFWHHKHCFQSYVAECERRQLPSHYQDCQQ